MRRNRFQLKLKEDATKYGEFVCSCHKWLPIEEQKEQAEHLDSITKLNMY